MKDDKLPDKYQIEDEIKQAEAKGVHREIPDMLDEATRIEVESGHLDNQLKKPSIEDLTR